MPELNTTRSGELPSGKTRVAILLSNLGGGGAERITVNLLRGFSPEHFDIDLILISAHGVFLEQVPSYVTVVDLARKGVSDAIWPLSRYLRQTRPDVLMSHLSHVNVGALLARRLAGTKTKVILVEHNDLSARDAIYQQRPPKRRLRLPQRQFLPQLMRTFYRQADAVIGVSHGVSRYVEARFKVPAAKLHTIYNPIVDSGLLAKAQAVPEHTWLQDASPEVPVLLAVGRLLAQKDFGTLLRAFAEVQQVRRCRLIIFGQGARQAELEALAHTLGIAEDVSFPGFTQNPYAAMSRASLYVLSSLWEGLPTVLVEAMACGCPVVATDCPSGPEEILAGGRYGPLVPVGDAGALAQAILGQLERPTDPELLRQRSQDFTYDRAVAAYSKLILELKQGVVPSSQ